MGDGDGTGAPLRGGGRGWHVPPESARGWEEVGTRPWRSVLAQNPRAPGRAEQPGNLLKG